MKRLGPAIGVAAIGALLGIVLVAAAAWLWAEPQESVRHLAVLPGLLLFAAVIAATLAAFALGVRARPSRRRHHLDDHLHDLADSLPVAVYRLRVQADASRHFEFVSHRSEAIRGVSADAVRHDARRLVDNVVEADRPLIGAAFRRAQADGTAFDVEFRIRRSDGTIGWLHSHAALRREADGSVLLNGYWADLTEPKRLMQQVEAARDAALADNRAKSAFLATMSHEIRTPMNGVFGMLELLDLTRLDAPQRTSLATAREAGRSLLRIVDDLLDLSKIEAGAMVLDLEVASLETVVDRSCRLFSATAQSKGVDLDCFIDPRIGAAHRADPLRLCQILNNLISNALKFTERGKVEVRVELLERGADAERLRISVDDSGIGISDEQRERLFQPFAQAAGNTAGRYGGTGLGLAICRRLTEMMSGSLEMSSTPGRGTTMRLELTLPIADPCELAVPAAQGVYRESARRPALPKELPRAGDGSLVLVVDDHPVNRIVLLRQVQTLGYAAVAVDNGEQALRSWESGRFGLLLTDCNMPLIDGYELTRTIRAREAARGAGHTPIIACTGNALGDEAELCFEAGMDDFIVKPVPLGELILRLGRWLPIVRPADAATNEADDTHDSIGPEDALLDEAHLAEISLGDAGFESEMVRDFRRAGIDDADLLREAARRGERKEISRLAHRLKGSCQVLGARRLAAACERVEQAASRPEPNALAAEMTLFEQQLAGLDRHLDQRLQRRGTPAPCVMG